MSDRRQRHQSADEDHRRPVDGAIGLIDGQDPRKNDRPGGEQAGDGGRHEAC